MRSVKVMVSAMVLTFVGVLSSQSPTHARTWACRNLRIGCPQTIPGTSANPPNPCVSVNSRQGWQRFNLPGGFTKVIGIGGGWSVDARSYAAVSASGHNGRDAEALRPYNQYKHDSRFPFGALLMGSGQGTLWIQGPASFGNTFGAVDMRINDADNALGDNAGSLQVCFGN